MATEIGWNNLHTVEPFGHTWLPSSLLSGSPKTNTVIGIWAVFFFLPLGLFAIAAWIDGTFHLGEYPEKMLDGRELLNGRGLLEDWTGIIVWVTVPILFSAAVIVFPKLAEVLISLQTVVSSTDTTEMGIDSAPRPSARRRIRKRRNRTSSANATFLD